MRFVAADEAEAKALSARLEQELSQRAEAKDRQAVNTSPHYVLVAVSTALAEKMGVFQRILSAPAGLGFSCVVLAPGLRELPKECSMVVELEEGKGAIYDKKDLSGRRLAFRPESAQGMDLDRAACVLANLEADTQQEQFTLPSMLTFLELYGVGKVEHLNALTRWKENNPVNTLQVPVGEGTDGQPFYLDLHEKFHGPHGLVAGMTGSGKSEFIITYILSLAVNFHPDEVAFILIDYKGGGMAKLGIVEGVGDDMFEPDREITRAEFTAMGMRFAEGETGGKNIFSDVDEDDWFYDAVAYAYENSLMAGTSGTTFSPDLTTTRAMIVTILYRLEDTPIVSGGSDFTDVEIGQWYSDAIAWAAANNIVGGYGKGLFGPDDPITREQLAAILYRYAQYKSYDTTASADLSRYTDLGQLSEWAQEAVAWANSEGIISGTSAVTLAPKDSATRAQATAMMMRFCENITP